MRLLLLSFLCIAALLSGCSKEPAAGELLSSDANGFLCRACKAKFYTSRSVYADKCPSCKSGDVAEIIGFYCPKDQHLTLTPKAKSTKCEQCNEEIGQVKLPTSQQLIAWGATKKTESEVK
jgi:hypothetical protein